MKKKDNQRGFTLAGLLILLAIIVMVALIMAPIIRTYIEKSNESADFINARTAYAGVMDAAVADDDEATYAGQILKQPDGTFQAFVAPLTQEVDGWSTDISKQEIGGMPGSDWLGKPRANGGCIVSYFPKTDKSQLLWGNRYFGLTLEEAHKADNNGRIAEDQKTLRLLGEAILEQGWTPEALEEFLALPESTEKTVRIAEYAQMKKGDLEKGYESAGFRIASKRNGQWETLMKEIAYYPGKANESEDKARTKTYSLNQYALFFSDELATNRYHGYDERETGRGIFVSNIETNDKGKIKKFTIYTDSINGEAKMGKDTRKKFRVVIEN